MTAALVARNVGRDGPSHHRGPPPARGAHGADRRRHRDRRRHDRRSARPQRRDRTQRGGPHQPRWRGARHVPGRRRRADGLLAAAVARCARQEPAGVADATPIAVATGELREKQSFLVFGVEADSFVWRSLVFVAGRGAQRGDEAVLGDAADAISASTSASVAAGGGQLPGRRDLPAGVPFETREPRSRSRSSSACAAAPGMPRRSRSRSHAGRGRPRSATGSGTRSGERWRSASPARSRASTRTASSCARRPWSSPLWR